MLEAEATAAENPVPAAHRRRVDRSVPEANAPSVAVRPAASDPAALSQRRWGARGTISRAWQ